MAVGHLDRLPDCSLREGSASPRWRSRRSRSSPARRLLPGPGRLHARLTRRYAPRTRSGAAVQLEVRLLGDVAVLADGHPLDLAGTRQRSVLALLVLNRNRAIATELLADRLWPDEQPLTAIKTIQVYVSRIRHALGPAAGRLTSSATGYSLAVADDELDAARFERGLRQAREALAAGSSETSLATLEAIIGLWSGPALGDLAGEQFARREADRLEELRLQALEELYELRIAAGQARQAIGDLRRLVSEAARPRATVAPAHARAVRRRPPRRGARGVPGRPPLPGRRAGPRSKPRAPGPRACDPDPAGAATGGSVAAIVACRRGSGSGRASRPPQLVAS